MQLLPSQHQSHFYQRRKERFGSSPSKPVRRYACCIPFSLTNSSPSLKTLFDSCKLFFSSSTQFFPPRIEPFSPTPLPSLRVRYPSFVRQICNLRVRRFFMSAMQIREYKQSMRAQTIILLALLALALADSKSKGDNHPDRPQNPPTPLTWYRLPPEGKRDADDIYKFVDHALRQKYWYYLTKACLLYVAAVERGDTYQFLAIYRNIVGTFLSITTWKNQSSTFDVNTLVRLGNGFAKNSNANYKPVNLRPSRFRYSLGPGQYLIDVNDCGDIKLNGKELSNDLDENMGRHKHHRDRFLVDKCQGFSEFTRKKFWYYLQDANVVYSSVGSTAERNYCLISYVNVAGTFFVVGSEGQKEKDCQVNTFVRLGNGCEGEDEYEPIVTEKVTLPLNSYEE